MISSMYKCKKTCNILLSCFSSSPARCSAMQTCHLQILGEQIVIELELELELEFAVLNFGFVTQTNSCLSFSFWSFKEMKRLIQFFLMRKTLSAGLWSAPISADGLSRFLPTLVLIPVIKFSEGHEECWNRILQVSKPLSLIFSLCRLQPTNQPTMLSNNIFQLPCKWPFPLLVLKKLIIPACHKSLDFFQANLAWRLRHASVFWLLFSIGHVSLMDVWLGQDQRTNIIFKKRLDYIFKIISYSTLDSKHNWENLYILLT